MSSNIYKYFYKISKVGKPLQFRKYTSRSNNKLSHYEILGVCRNANDNEIKRKFRELSKKYHPDIVNSSLKLSKEDKDIYNEKFIELVTSYEVLKDKDKRLNYDRSQGQQGHTNIDRSSERRDFQNKYYGVSNTYTTRSGLNMSRNRVSYKTEQEEVNTYFNGQWRDYSKNDDVPHFDYYKHLAKNINIDKRFNNSRADYHSTNLFNYKINGSGKNQNQKKKQHRQYHSINYKENDKDGVVHLISGLLLIGSFISVFNNNNRKKKIY